MDRQEKGGRRLTAGRWRRQWRDASAAPTAADVEALAAALAALALPEDGIEIEREMLDGSSSSLPSHAPRPGLPLVETGHRVVGTDVCHFTAPASMPDDPSQPSGAVDSDERARDLRRRGER